MSFIEPIEEPKEVTPTWETDVLIPLTQNILGGVAVGGLGMIGVMAYTGTTGTMLDLYNAGVWCALGGGLVTCVITVIRFFGDDLGMLQSAYHTGYTDAQSHLMPQINHLQMLLDAAYDAQNAVESEGGGATATIKKNQELMERARKDAGTIIKIAFQGDNVRRDAMAGRGMGRRDWERATNLLKASGAMNGDGEMVAMSPAQALQAVEELAKKEAGRPDNFTTKY